MGSLCVRWVLCECEWFSPCVCACVRELCALYVCVNVYRVCVWVVFNCFHGLEVLKPLFTVSWRKKWSVGNGCKEIHTVITTMQNGSVTWLLKSMVLKFLLMPTIVRLVSGVNVITILNILKITPMSYMTQNLILYGLTNQHGQRFWRWWNTTFIYVFQLDPVYAPPNFLTIMKFSMNFYWT